MSGEDVQVDDWVVHRPNVVRSVAARVPGIDAEEAASRALEKMVRIVSTGGTIDDPAPYWRRAAVNEAISMTREAGRTHAVEDDTLDGLTPPVEGAELDAEREADVSMLRSALSDLADDDRKILLDRHVHDMAVTDIAGDLGVRPHAVTMRLRRAEERLAGAFAAAHAQNVNEPECRTTRAAMHDYLKGRLLPRRQRRLEVHMDGCGECTRAFIDVREVSWMLRDLGQHLIAGGVATGAVGTAAIGTAGGALGTARPRSFGTKHAAVAAGVVAALVLGAGAAALIAGLPASMSIQAVGEPPPSGGSDAPATNPPRDPAPPQTEPTDPPHTPGPADEKSHPPPAAEPVTAPVAAVEPAAVAKPHERPEPESRPEAPRATPAPAVEKPKPDKPKEPPKPSPAKPSPGKPEKPPTSGPPDKGHTGGPPGNPSNDHGKGPGKDNNQGPGKGNGHGHGHDKGPGHGNGHGRGHDKGPGNGHGKGQGPGSGNGKGSGHGAGNSQGQGSGSGKGKGSGHGKGQSAGKGHGHGNGPGTDHAKGRGSGHGKDTGFPRR